MQAQQDKQNTCSDYVYDYAEVLTTSQKDSLNQLLRVSHDHTYIKIIDIIITEEQHQDSVFIKKLPDICEDATIIILQSPKFLYCTRGWSEITGESPLNFDYLFFAEDRVRNNEYYEAAKEVIESVNYSIAFLKTADYQRLTREALETIFMWNGVCRLYEQSLYLSAELLTYIAQNEIFRAGDFNLIFVNHLKDTRNDVFSLDNKWGKFRYKVEFENYLKKYASYCKSFDKLMDIIEESPSLMNFEVYQSFKNEWRKIEENRLREEARYNRIADIYNSDLEKFFKENMDAMRISGFKIAPVFRLLSNEYN